MGTAGIAAIIIGYAFAYSGISNLITAGHGWGLFQSMINTGTNTNMSMSSFVQQIQPQGNSGSSSPDSADSPVSGTVQA